MPRATQTTAASVSVTVANDTTAPTVAVTSPAAASTVSGTVTVIATATDDVGVAGVQFQLDGVSLGAEDTTAPYELAWNTATVRERRAHADRRRARCRGPADDGGGGQRHGGERHDGADRDGHESGRGEQL